MKGIGHRGAAGLAPENTFAGFDLALALGVDGIETDVQKTKDGKLVLFVTFDEGETSVGCCNDAVGGQVTTLVISPLIKRGFQLTIPETHYSLLRTIEQVWDLPFLGEASKSTAMTEYFT